MRAADNGAIDHQQYRNWKISYGPGVFDPKPIGRGTSASAQEIKDDLVIYHIVTPFVSAVRAYSYTNPGSPMIRNLTQMLRGDALEWYNSAVSPEEKITFVTATDGLEQWCSALEEHFEPSPEEARELLHSITYTVADARRGIRPDRYFNQLLNAVQQESGHRADDAYLISIAWSQLDTRFKQHFARLGRNTTAKEFLQRMEDAYPSWHLYPADPSDGRAKQLYNPSKGSAKNVSEGENPPPPPHNQTLTNLTVRTPTGT